MNEAAICIADSVTPDETIEDVLKDLFAMLDGLRN